MTLKNFKGPLVSMASPLTEISLDYGGKLKIVEKFRMRNGAVCKIGRNISVNCNNMIACRERTVIDDDVHFSPKVQIYDHDHDYRAEGGVKAGKYKTAPVEIGNNVWIGVDTIILRGTKIGDNAAIGDGSVVKGEVPAGAVLV